MAGTLVNRHAADADRTAMQSKEPRRRNTAMNEKPIMQSKLAVWTFCRHAHPVAAGPGAIDGSESTKVRCYENSLQSFSYVHVTAHPVVAGPGAIDGSKSAGTRPREAACAVGSGADAGADAFGIGCPGDGNAVHSSLLRTMG